MLQEGQSQHHRDYELNEQIKEELMAGAFVTILMMMVALWSTCVSLFCRSSNSMYDMIVIYHHKDGVLLFKCLLDGIVYYI